MKKIIGVALSISMLISALPQTAVWAADNKCGDNLTWNISNNGTLTINGTGDMYNYHPTGEAPWYSASLNGDVKYIKISQGVESLSDYAFQSSTELKEVMISTTVKQIGLNPFVSSNKLQGIYVVPGENPYYCSVGGVLFDKSKTKLVAYPIGKTENSYEIPDSVTTIQTGAFDSSTLTSIKIPKSVTKIEEYAFYAANDITDIYYGGTAEDWNKINFDKASNFGISSNNEKLTMHYTDTPKTVAVESISFNTDKLILTKGKSAVINVTFIPSDATNKSITWSSSNNEVAAVENGTVTAVGKGSAVIKAVTADGNKTAECTVTVTEPESGNKCGDSLTWNLDTDGTLTVNGTGDMYDYSESNPAPWKDSIDQIKKIILSDGVTSIGNYAFYPYKYSYLTMTVPESLKKIGNNAFVEVIDNEHGWIFGRLSYIDYSGAVEDFKNISIGTGNTGLRYTSTYYNKIKNPVSGFYRNEDSDSTDIKWTLNTNGILTVSGNGSMPFEKGGGVYNADGFFDNLVKKIIINEGITGISSFFDLENLEEVTLPSTLKTIENSCFSGDVKLKNILIPDKTEKIGEYAFSGTEIEHLTIPKSVKNIGESIVVSTPLYDNESNWTNGALYIDNWLIDIESNLNGEFNVKPGTTGISGGSIKAGISSVTLPQTVKYLSDDAFVHFKGNEISIPYGTIEIGKAFFFSGAKTVYIPRTVTRINNEAFAYSSIEDIYYEGTEEEWNKLFSSESERVIPKKTIIHFNNNSSGDKEKLYQYEVNDGKAAITAVDKSISGDIIIPSTLGGYPVESIGNEVFRDCSKLTSVVIPESVKSIGYSNFTYCDSLEQITIPGELEFEYGNEVFGTNQFYKCTKLKEIKVSGNSTKYSADNGILFSKDGKTLIAYPPGKQDISYTVPSNVEKIGISAFESCNNLRAIIIPEGVVSIDSMSLWCDNLEVLTIPKTAVEFGWYQYWGNVKTINVYYAGTEEEYESKVGKHFNERVTLHYNYTAKEITVTTDAQNGQADGGGKFMFGSLVTLTSAPDSGYRFAGWYINDTLVSSESEYSFIAHDDVNVTAKFNKYSSGGSLSGGYTAKYTVTFVSNGGTDVEAVSAAKNTAVSKPADPTKDGFTFNGWYADKELTNKYDFSTKLLADLTLYAGWISNDDAQNQIVLTIGKTDASVFGEKMTNDVAPLIRNDRTMLPARFVAENLGAAVKWNEESREVLITGKKTDGSDITIKIYIDSDTAYVNNEKITLDSPAFIENDRTYTPVRFIAEQLGARVEWNESEQKVIITKN